MKAYSAAEAISPAIERMKQFLFQPFRFWTFVKLALVAALTEGGGGSFSGNVPSMPSGSHSTTHSFVTHTYVSESVAGLPWSASDLGVLVVLPAMLLGLGLMLWLWYLVVRLRFAYFHCLLYGTRRIRDGWAPYARAAMRMFQLQLLVTVCVLALLAVIAVPIVFLFSRGIGGGQELSPALILLLVGLGLPLVAVLVFVSIAYEIITHDFMLPHMALEDATVGEAWRASRLSYLGQKGAFWLYGLLRVLFGIVGQVAVIMILAIPLIVVVLFDVAVWAGIADSHNTAFYAAGIAMIAVSAVLVLFAMFLLSGPIGTWVRQYALLFYGGRFAAMGNVIAPPPPPEPLPDASTVV